MRANLFAGRAALLAPQISSLKNAWEEHRDAKGSYERTSNISDSVYVSTAVCIRAGIAIA
jgi:hypothetical protein